MKMRKQVRDKGKVASLATAAKALLCSIFLTACLRDTLELRPINPNEEFLKSYEANAPYETCADNFEFVWPYVEVGNIDAIELYAEFLFFDAYASPLWNRKLENGRPYVSAERMMMVLEFLSSVERGKGSLRRVIEDFPLTRANFVNTFVGTVSSSSNMSVEIFSNLCNLEAGEYSKGLS